MPEKTNEITKRLLALAKEKQLDLSEAQAEIYAKRLAVSNGALADAELDNVSGGMLFCFLEMPIWLWKCR